MRQKFHERKLLIQKSINLDCFEKATQKFRKKGSFHNNAANEK